MTARPARPLRWHSAIADVILGALLIGPLAAPFLQAWEPLVPRAVSGIISTMGAFVCPQPARAAALYEGNLMAVCMRCYGTVLGLLVTRLLYAADDGAGRGWLARYGLGALPLFTVLIFAYPIEFGGQIVGLWRFDHTVVTIAGMISGAGLGLMFHPLLQHDRPSNPA